ncbi:hypothetical protein IW261DRAFT_1415554 [Armillaria novae-zelandiae]|uniref:Uncharacterized protein n=1 Tax=Armillaria novae-zelandiae TaxID=153914 RepID=A0AA39PRJ8_9AGAR|nr:hypothetical protein IW261DRAFT_1415554 [Armillaria novae-zelandiae]
MAYFSIGGDINVLIVEDGGNIKVSVQNIVRRNQSTTLALFFPGQGAGDENCCNMTQGDVFLPRSSTIVLEIGSVFNTYAQMSSIPTAVPIKPIGLKQIQLRWLSRGNNARFANLGDRFASNELYERLEILPQHLANFLLAYEMSRCQFVFPSLEGWALMHGIKSKSQPKSPDWIPVTYQFPRSGNLELMVSQPIFSPSAHSRMRPNAGRIDVRLVSSFSSILTEVRFIKNGSGFVRLFGLVAECITGALVRGVGVERCGDLVISQYAAQGRSAWWILARTPDDSDCVLAPRDQYHALIR